MPKYNHELNEDKTEVKTPAEYDSASGKWITNTRLTGSKVQTFTIVNALAITDTNMVMPQLSSSTGLTKDEIRQIKRIGITVYNSHDATGTFAIYRKNLAGNNFSGSDRIHVGSTDFTSATDYLFYLPDASGSGKQVNGLKSIFSDLAFYVKHDTAPTKGSLTITVELGW